MNCPKCSTEISENEKKCPACGYDLSPEYSLSARIWAVIGIIALIAVNIVILLYIKG